MKLGILSQDIRLYSTSRLYESAKNRRGILLSNFLRVFTTVSYLFMWGEATIIRSLLNLIIIHHVIVVTTTFVLYFKKEGNTTSEELNSI